MNEKLRDLVADDSLPCWERAQMCLGALAELPLNDGARPEFIAAAQTFGLLAVAEAIGRQGENGAGYTLAQAVLAAGGVQP
jgi:hypothetical protein